MRFCLKSNVLLCVSLGFICASLCALFYNQTTLGHQRDWMPEEIDYAKKPKRSKSNLGLVSPFKAGFNSVTFMIDPSELTGLPESSALRTQIERFQKQAFRTFMRLYNKSYPESDIPRRLRLFLDRRKKIENSVKDYESGRLPFKMAENAYLDWDERELKALTGVSPPHSVAELTPEERAVILKRNQHQTVKSAPLVRAQTVGYYTYGDEVPASSSSRKRKRTSGKPLVRVPASKDWRESSCIAPPVYQGACGCCYAIATMAVLESMRCINDRPEAPLLSPQQIIDCSKTGYGFNNNYGCNGGWPTKVLNYLADVGVAARESCYPLTLRDNYCDLERVATHPTCVVSSSPTDTKLKYRVLTNEQDILYHVANTGPVISVMHVSNSFLYYSTGVFDDPTCSGDPDDVDHAVVIVGYGRENGRNYWLVKNSWGTKWGDGGYVKLRRGTHACSIGYWGWVIIQ